jgi:ATP-dependent Clp protease ATP-binding subunit ClpA
MKMLQGERENYCIWKELHQRVVGQEEAIEAVVMPCKPPSSGRNMKKPSRNIHGTTGVGKKPSWQSIENTSLMVVRMPVST